MKLGGQAFTWKDDRYSENSESQSAYLKRFSQKISQLLPAEHADKVKNLLINRLLVTTTQTIEAPYYEEFKAQLQLDEGYLAVKDETLRPQHSITTDGNTLVKTAKIPYKLVDTESRDTIRRYETVIEQQFDVNNADLLDESVSFSLVQLQSPALNPQNT